MHSGPAVGLQPKNSLCRIYQPPTFEENLVMLGNTHLVVLGLLFGSRTGRAIVTSMISIAPGNLERSPLHRRFIELL